MLATADPGPWPRQWAPWIAVGLFALAVRVLYVVLSGPRHLPLADPLWYHLEANAISRGHGFVNPFLLMFGGRSVPTASEPPLFPLVLAAASVLGAGTVLWHQLVGCMVGVGTVLTVGRIAAGLAGDRAGLISAGVAGAYPVLWLNDAGVTAEGPFALAVAGVILAAYRFERTRSMRRAGILGLCLGLAMLTRVEAALLVPLLVLPLVLRGHRAVHRRLAVGAVVLSITLMVLAPWVVRNLATFTRPTLLSTGDGTVLGANCDGAYRGPKVGLWLTTCYTQPPPGDESVANAAWRAQGLAYARHHLGRAAVVGVIRVARTWDLYGPLRTPE